MLVLEDLNCVNWLPRAAFASAGGGGSYLTRGPVELANSFTKFVMNDRYLTCNVFEIFCSTGGDEIARRAGRHSQTEIVNISSPESIDVSRI